MLKKILDYIQKYHMIEEGDTIVAGISGGADSVCLLFVLLEIQKKLSFDIEVVHINHGIRREAKEDARFVEDLCRQRGILFHLTEENIKERAKRSGHSEEEEGRLVRYQAFREALGSRKGRIAVAHNSNDRAETMLFHLFRGTGLTGAGGILPVNGNIIRPLLCVERKEIEVWLAERRIVFCTDYTNEQDIYTRNRIRHHILTYAEENICKGTVANMNRGADQMMEAEEYLARQTTEAADRCVSAEGQNLCIKIPEFLKEDGYLQSRILLWCLSQAAGSKKDLTAAHVQSIKTLFEKQGNGEIHLPYELIVYKKYDLGMIERKTSSVQQNHSLKGIGFAEEYEVNLSALNEGTHFEIPGLGSVEITVFPKGESQNIPQKTYTKWFDYDKITKSAVFRTKRPGDYLTINRMLGRKSLQDYFVNEKVPRENRDEIYLFADGPHVIWVPGYRISEYYKISEETKTILQVQISEKTSKEERSHFNG